MIREREGFHLVDLLALRMRTVLAVPGESRSLSALLARLTGLELPARFYPPPLMDIADAHLCEQFPWLNGLRLPKDLRAGDWAMFWAWVDTVQRRVGTEENDWGRDFPVEPIGADRLEIIVLDVDEDYPEG